MKSWKIVTNLKTLSLLTILLVPSITYLVISMAPKGPEIHMIGAIGEVC